MESNVTAGTNPTPPNDRELLLHNLRKFINKVCVNSTGRLGIVTHVDHITYSEPLAAGFALDGKGIWTSGSPIIVDSAENIFEKWRVRFGGAQTLHPIPQRQLSRIAEHVVMEIKSELYDLSGDPVKNLYSDNDNDD